MSLISAIFQPIGDASHREFTDGPWQCVDLQDFLFEILERRLGNVPEAARETIMATSDKGFMIRLFRKAIQASSMEKFVNFAQENGS